MKTPIIGFAEQYIKKNGIRMHMPGHKGMSVLGCEALDLTEIEGADSLYEASGIIAESEARSAALFGAKKTLYSTEGSSQCIRAMLALIRLYSQNTQRKPYILASRNVHKTFVTAAGLLGIEVRFLAPAEGATLLYAPIDLSALEKSIREDAPSALYITSPDYLGNTAPIEKLSALCHRHGVLLCVDNAHGAYLRFLSPSRHPLDLGADLCCDSAHKTLPALTGAAYLHLAAGLPAYLYEQAKDMMALFGSTSPSYLILESLDLMSGILKKEFGEKLNAFLPLAEDFKNKLSLHGFALAGDEPMKVTLLPKCFGYTGTEVAAHLRNHNIECEFADSDSLVLMLSPYMTADMLTKAADALTALPCRTAIKLQAPVPHIPPRALSIREAMLAPSECVPLDRALGRTAAMLSVGCPPAVPPVICGEVLDEKAIALLRYLGITECRVMI